MIKYKDGLIETVKDVIDYLLPLQTPTEQAIYIYLFRNSVLIGKNTIQIGERSLAKSVSKPAKGKLSKSKGLSYSTIRSNLRTLEEKTHISVLSTEQKGKIIRVKLPEDVEECRSLMYKDKPKLEIDYYNDPSKRMEIFERDNWTCYFCGQKVTTKNATLDHYVPQFKGGKHSKENLKTACLICNSIKSGKTYEEAAPLLLKSLKERNSKI